MAVTAAPADTEASEGTVLDESGSTPFASLDAIGSTVPVDASGLICCAARDAESGNFALTFWLLTARSVCTMAGCSGLPSFEAVAASASDFFSSTFFIRTLSAEVEGVAPFWKAAFASANAS